MTKPLVAFVLAHVLLGCASAPPGAISLAQLANENQTTINKLTVGIAKPAVIELMGVKTAATPDGLVANPFRSETFQDKAGAQYEILYYVTETNRRFQPLRLSQTTPLVLKNGVLIGWGTQSLRQAKEQMTTDINVTIDRK